MSRKELLIISVLVTAFLLIGAIFVFSQPSQVPSTESLVDECQGMTEKECQESSICRVQAGKRGEFITCCPSKSAPEQREECLRVY